MHIQWHPGHMTKALRMMEENLKLVDGVLFVLDARCPVACLNRKLIKLFQNKKTLYILNKSDLTDRRLLSGYIDYFAQGGITAAAAVGTDSKSIKEISKIAAGMLTEKTEKNAQRGINKKLRFMVCGIPNTGKSTIINTLCGEKRAQTGDKAGVTKGKQWINAGEYELLDTPGTMPPSFDNQVLARHLAYIGSINDSILDFSELLLEFIREIKELYPGMLAEKYGADETGEPLSVYESICKKRGYLLKGGEFDYERCAVAVMDDFRKGRIGKIALDRVHDGNLR